MGKTLPQITDALAEFIGAQHMFFVATAPTSTDGLVNMSPKGLDGSFIVLGPHEVAYLDLTGSGAETIAHLRDNGRICLMFCAFEGPPRIVRLHGAGEVVLPGDDLFSGLAARFAQLPGVRSIIRVDVTRVADSCGFAVPRMSYEADRDQLLRWAENRGEEGIAAYQATRNAVSIDGLPALTPAQEG